MSLFQCDECGCCENTELCSYHWNRYRGLPALCSACEGREAGKPGEWHGLFDRVFLPKGEFRTNSRGNLEHRETGDEDFRKFALPLEQTHEMHALFDVGAAMCRALVDAVSQEMEAT